VQRVLIVEPDAGLRALLGDCVRAAGWRADPVADFAAARTRVPREHTVALVDVASEADLSALAELCARAPDRVTVAMTPRDRLALSVAALRHGARDVLGKPFDVRALERALAVATSLRMHTAESLAAALGALAAPASLLREVEAAARTDATLQIVGEAGTGRRRLARLVHAASPRRCGPLVAIDGEAVAGELERWASDPLAAALRAAQGGTLVLATPEALPAPAQARLLEALATPRRHDVRVIAVARRRLRDEPRLVPELRLRLDVLVLALPPLRERTEDLERLARSLAERWAALEGTAPPRLGPELLAALRRHPFPGNLVELDALMRRAATLFPGRDVDPRALLAGPRASAGGPAAEAASDAVDPDATLDLRELERRAVVRALALHGGNRTHAARALGISVRTLRNKIQAYGLR
jgi:two-component system response regulator PilR (NtrC family)